MHVDDVLVGVRFVINQHNKNSFIMKKVLFIAVAAIAVLSFSSCKDTKCTCTEKNTGASQEFDLSGQDVYDTCGDVEDLLNDASEGYLDWNC